uniref:Uncharacterized protein n=1 Tax=Triticum urartu TaxID=4572 RepID=A0A8R7Q7J1_TRIUA
MSSSRNRVGHLDRIHLGVTLPDPRPFHGEKTHDPELREEIHGSSDTSERQRRRPRSSAPHRLRAPPPATRSDAPDPLPPVLRIQAPPLQRRRRTAAVTVLLPRISPPPPSSDPLRRRRRQWFRGRYYLI